MIGQGIDVQAINRIRDELLDKRIVGQQNLESYWKTRSDYYTMLEQIYNEPYDVSIRSNMDKFWQSWQELSVYPESKNAITMYLKNHKFFDYLLIYIPYFFFNNQNKNKLFI